MKIKLQTSTGKTIEIEVSENATIRDVKRALYKSGKIAGAVKVLKSQEVLPDDSTLQQHNITEGSTVNIVVEPDRDINIQVNYEALSFKYKLTNATSVLGLKDVVANEIEMSLPPVAFDLVLEPTEAGTPLQLDDVNLPLHFYGVTEESSLSVEKSYEHIIIENQKGATVHLNVPKSTKVGEIRKRMFRLAESGGKCIDSVVILAATEGVHDRSSTRYKRLLDDEATVGEVVGLGHWFVIENSYTKLLPNITFSDIRPISGIEAGDTAKSVKLRAHDQLDLAYLPVVASSCEGLEQYQICREDNLIDTSTKYIIFSSASAMEKQKSQKVLGMLNSFLSAGQRLTLNR